MSDSIMQTTIKSLPLVYRGKVRECYAVGEDKLLMIATDRISAFDVILSVPIAKKGKVLTALTKFWFDKLAADMPTQLTGIDPESVVAEDERCQVRGRAMVVKRLKPILIECVARGYIIGGGWKDYQATGKVCGVTLPEGLRMAEKLPEPIFTPAAKAEVGTHDENISFEKVLEMYGESIATQIRDLTLKLYKRAADYAATQGIIIADTKFEFGLDEDGNVCLMDEVLTPDSSRFWPADQYDIGISPPSFDKQFIRDWLETQVWDKTPPAPIPPADVLQKTSDKYIEALTRLTGIKGESL
ncbi:MAG: phosphoribosylaminoimidazolesuccinocarboxamide synthase [Duodenibacillus sp.]